MFFQMRPLSYTLGAEITGINLQEQLDDETFNVIYQAFLVHSILLFRRQTLTREKHIAFSRRFGEVDTNETVLRRNEDYPEIQVNIPQPDVSQPGNLSDTSAGRYWHTDQPHTPQPPMASLLRAIEVPAVGGDTLFANMSLAYEALSDGMKRLIDGVYCVHFGGNHRRIDNSSPERAAESRRLNPPIAQPLVRRHPETGRKALYFTEKVQRFVDMTAEESAPLLAFLCKHATRPQFVYRHQWQSDDLIMWDNRCTMHHALGDYDLGATRHMERTTVKGNPSGYIYKGPLN